MSDAGFETLLYDVDGPIATITLNRPEKLNAMTSVMEDELSQALARADADHGVSAAILTGAGRGFCAGADLSVRLPPRVLKAGEHRFDFIRNFSKPLFAGINGAAAGLGFSLVLYCDFRFVVADAKLTTAFARRGLIAEHGSAWLLPRIVGEERALELLLGSPTISGTEAAEMGLARLLPKDDFQVHLLERVLALLDGCSPRSMRVMKRLVTDARTQTLDQALAVSDIEQQASIASEDCKEGVAAFLERRKPNFSGR